MKKKFGLIMERERAFIVEGKRKEKIIACKALAFANGKWHLLSHCGYISEADKLEDEVPERSDCISETNELEDVVSEQSDYIFETDGLKDGTTKELEEDVKKIVVLVNFKKKKASLEFDNSDERFQIEKMIMIWRVVNDWEINGLVMKKKKIQRTTILAIGIRHGLGTQEVNSFCPFLKRFAIALQTKRLRSSLRNALRTGRIRDERRRRKKEFRSKK